MLVVVVVALVLVVVLSCGNQKKLSFSISKRRPGASEGAPEGLPAPET